MRSAVLAGLALCAVSCASGPVRPAALAYRAQEPSSVGYRMADTVRVEIRAMGQAFSVEGGARSDWLMEITPNPGGVRVSATLIDLDARMTNPLGPARSVDESQVRGAVVFTLDTKGTPTIVRLPELGGGAAQFLTGATVAHGFFPRLPGRALAVGESWVDSVSWSGTEAGTETSVRTAWTYTAVGDTTVGGVRYTLVHARGDTEQSSGGTIAGAEFTQSVAGPVEGSFLWDPVAGALHASEYTSDLTGTTELSIAPVALEVNVRSVVRVSRTTLP